MRQEYTDEIDLLQIFEIAKKKMIILILLVAIFASGFFVYTKLFIDKMYTATATVIIVQKNDGLNSNSVTMSDVQFSQKLVDTYKQILMSEAIGDKVIADLDLYNEYGITYGSLKNMLSVSSANGTEVMNISVTSNDPVLSANMANGVVEVFQEEIYNIMNIENVSVLNNAKVPTTHSSPSTTKNMMFGVILGVVLFGILVLKDYLTDNKVKTEDDLKMIFDYPIIGIIPEFEIDDNNAGGKK